MDLNGKLIKLLTTTNTDRRYLRVKIILKYIVYGLILILINVLIWRIQNVWFKRTFGRNRKERTLDK